MGCFLPGPCLVVIRRTSYWRESVSRDGSVGKVGGWCEMVASLLVLRRQSVVNVRMEAENSGEDTANPAVAILSCRVCELAIAL
jgi:hypothetical protein